jgi:putative FmdB family regulatory protein
VLTVNEQRTVYHALLVATAVALGLLLLRINSTYAPSLVFEFLSNRLTYIYVFVATAVVCLAIGYVLGREVNEFRRLALIDPLTGLANRRALQAHLRAEWHRSQRAALRPRFYWSTIPGMRRRSRQAKEIERSTQMPVYEYICRDCQRSFEITRPIAAPAMDAKCPACGSTQVDRTYSQVYAKTSKKS